NLVIVPVVIRDRQGKAVGNLKQEDFQLFDKGKTQFIARFSMERAAGRLNKAGSAAPAPNDPDKLSEDKPAADLPDRFIAYLFDDVHMNFGDLRTRGMPPAGISTAPCAPPIAPPSTRPRGRPSRISPTTGPCCTRRWANCACARSPDRASTAAPT